MLNIKKVRLKYNIKQITLANVLDCSRSTILAIESGALKSGLLYDKYYMTMLNFLSKRKDADLYDDLFVEYNDNIKESKNKESCRGTAEYDINIEKELRECL